MLGILRRDGALAERLVVPERCLVSVPDSLSDERAVFDGQVKRMRIGEMSAVLTGRAPR